jgi:hypothetical protein
MPVGVATFRLSIADFEPDTPASIGVLALNSMHIFILEKRRILMSTISERFAAFNRHGPRCVMASPPTRADGAVGPCVREARHAIRCG